MTISQVAARSTNPDMTTVFHVRPYGKIVETQSNLWRKQSHRMNQVTNFGRTSFCNRAYIRASIQFRRERQSQHLKRCFFINNRPVDFHISSTSFIRLIKQNRLSFSSLRINKPFPTPVQTISKIRFKFRSQLQLLLEIRCLTKLSKE